MKNWFAFGLLLSLLTDAAAQGPPPRRGVNAGRGSGPGQDQPPIAAQATDPNVKKGSIEGVVTSATGEPLRKAEVRVFRTDVRQMGPGSGSMAVADDNGRFLIKDLEPGRYNIFAQRTGYVTGSFGARRAGSRAGTPVTLSEGQEMKNLEIKLFKQGVIAGRVLDEDGEPLQNAQVQLMQQRYMRGRKQLAPMQGAQVNDLGEYRVAGLPPGKYYVSVNPQRLMMMRGGQATPASDKPYDEGYTVMYYPNATEASQATLVEVTPGSELTGIDFRLRKVRTFRVRGKVLDAHGQPARNVFLMATPQGDSFFMGMRGGSGVRGNSGVFELSGLTPGQYNLVANLQSDNARVQTTVPISLGEQHLNDVVVQLAEPLTIKATVRVEGKETVELGEARLMFESPRMMPFMNNGAQAKQGVFEVGGVSAGRYRATLTGLPDGHYVKSVRFGTQEAIGQMVDFSAGAAPIEIVLSDKAGSVTGTVQDPEGKPSAGVTVVLTSADPAKREGSEAFRVSQSDQSGAFTVKSLPPGEWLAFAFADAEDGAYQDPEWLKKYETGGAKLNVKESGSETVTLKILQ